MTDQKDNIIEQLEILAKHTKTSDEKNASFKYRAYLKAIKSLREHKDKIITVNDIEGLEGIGAKIRAKIQEFLTIGHIQEVERVLGLEDATGDVQLELEKIYGIGPVKAKSLINEHEIQSVKQLQALVKAHPDTKILNEKQKLGLKHHDDIQKRIPHDEIKNHDKFIQKIISKFNNAKNLNSESNSNSGSDSNARTERGDTSNVGRPRNKNRKSFNSSSSSDKRSKPTANDNGKATKVVDTLPRNFIGQITGSYRRKSPTSGDIDLLVSRTSRVSTLSPQEEAERDIQLFGQLINTFIDSGYITDILAHGKHKLMGMAKLESGTIHRRIDIIFVPPEQYAFGLLYFTGSGEFNVAIRQIALNQGYSLNEKELTYINPPLKGKRVEQDFPTEESILNFLGIEYIEPEKRYADEIYKNLIQI